MFLHCITLVVLFVACAHGVKPSHGHFGNSSYDPTIFTEYFLKNRMQQCYQRAGQAQLPRSYYIYDGYFDSIPPNQRVPPGDQTQPQVVPSCNGRLVQVPELQAYAFESERYLATIGLNIYDGAVWSLAVAKLNLWDQAYAYMDTIINAGETCQFSDIRGDAPCKGDIVKGECADPYQSGACGFCYGDSSDRTVTKPNAFTFRMISDYWSLQGTTDARCPDLGHTWTWNDYRPVLGENAWANILAPLQVAYMRYGSVTAIPSNDLAVQMALNILPTLQKMVTPNGALYYAPHNTLDTPTHDTGFAVSTENNVSLLSGLRALRYYIMKNNVFLDKLPVLNSLINSIESYLKSAYSPHLGYFVQGGSYDPATMKFTWATGSTMFAVDCQTWTLSSLDPLTVDAWFGAGTSESIWATTKRMAGYNYDPVTKLAEGVGFTDNDNTVFSGEWTMGAVNMLKIFANVFNKPEYATEAQYMRDAVQSKLVQTQQINGASVTGVAYANKRYYIPFGWWANPVLSTASTGWTVLYDSNYNPFHLGGDYSVAYDM